MAHLVKDKKESGNTTVASERACLFFRGPSRVEGYGEPAIGPLLELGPPAWEPLDDANRSPVLVQQALHTRPLL